MNPSRLLRPRRLWPFFVLALCLAQPLLAQEKRALTFADLMRFQTIHDPVISDDGAWLAFTAAPDRGDGEAVVRAVTGDARYVVPRGSRPVISKDGAWVAMRLDPPFAETEKAGDEKDKPKPGMALLRTATGEVVTVDSVETFAFSKDGAWLAALHFAPKDTTKAEGKKDDRRKPGAPLVLRELGTGREIDVPDVRAFAFDEEGRFVAYAVAAGDSTRDGLYVRDLRADGAPETTLDARPRGHYASLTWSEAGGSLAFLAATEDDDGEPGPATLYVWDGDAPREAATPDDAPDGWTLPAKNTLRWTKDGARLFFGFRPETPAEDEASDDTTAADPYDVDAILEKRTVDVWHWNDSLIIPNQKKQWKESRDRTYEAVYHRADGRVVPLADRVVWGQGEAENARVMLGRAEVPYYKLRTWEGFFFDPYVIRLSDGAKTKIAEKLSNAVSLSPEGRFVAYYKTPHWYLYDVESGATRTLTEGLGVPFANEDHDYPSEAPGYGVAGWVAGDRAVLINDKYDVWRFSTEPDVAPVRLTGGEGRATGRTFRIVRTDPEQRFFEEGETVLLSSYHHRKKNDGFYRAVIGETGVERLLEEEKKFAFIAKAKDAEVYLFTREDYDEFPDLWVSDPAFEHPRRLTDLDAQRDPFAWGTSELVEWRSDDGIPLQGVVIKPGDYEPGKRYPVLVYFYRFMSQRLHDFNEPVVNHRPSFPLYASNGYVVFLPDVRFEIGRPGFSATKAVVPGVQKLIDMGLADPDAVGLHGHSWSGYQTAFMVTQTNIFKAAVAGAPVSNMTSAYGGIRWGSGLARQFQYEKTQSRLGGSLWEARDRYIDNSPLFFADRIHTPLLIIHGDDDGAVPWYQSIELYLALRRLGKESVFLEYRGEDHHPAKYANKLDWAMRMKQYFDHYLKGAPAPAWIEKGVPYEGK
ncbi:S9 family peptidase [Rhodocaloribacter sp.]